MRLMGTFDAPTYISIGDDYAKKLGTTHMPPFPFLSYDAVFTSSASSLFDRLLFLTAPDPRYRSKQFQTSPSKKGTSGARTQNTMFEPEFLMLYKNEKYSQQNWYNVDLANPKEPKENPKGFRSSDNAKRDEFSNSVRTAQWRENLKVSRQHLPLLRLCCVAPQVESVLPSTMGP